MRRATVKIVDAKIVVIAKTLGKGTARLRIEGFRHWAGFYYVAFVWKVFEKRSSHSSTR